MELKYGLSLETNNASLIKSLKGFDSYVKIEKSSNEPTWLKISSGLWLLSNLFRFKDSIPKELRSHIVYKFLCSNCNITYYGETERHLNVRSGEHLSLSALTGKRVNNNKKSAAKDHCLFFNHMGSFEDFSILTYESNPLKLLIKEALLVSRDKPLLNKQVKSIPLQLF